MVSKKHFVSSPSQVPGFFFSSLILLIFSIKFFRCSTFQQAVHFVYLMQLVLTTFWQVVNSESTWIISNSDFILPRLQHFSYLTRFMLFPSNLIWTIPWNFFRVEFGLGLRVSTATALTPTRLSLDSNPRWKHTLGRRRGYPTGWGSATLQYIHRLQFRSNVKVFY